MADDSSDQGPEPTATEVEPATDDATAESGTAVAVTDRPGAVELAAQEQRVELRKDRVWLPFLVPVGAILAVALFTINISRVFLAASQSSTDPAVIAAIIVTLLVLFGATAIAAVPKLRTSTLVLTVSGITALVLLSGSLTLGAAEDKAEAVGPPNGPAINTLEVDASNFQFQAKNFDVPAGINDIKYRSLEGSHTLAFDQPELSYFHLAQPGGQAEEKVDLVAGKSYTIYCTIPGHRAAGMEATITVTAGGGKVEPGTQTPATTLVPGASTTTTPGGKSQVDSSSQSGNQLGN